MSETKQATTQNDNLAVIDPIEESSIVPLFGQGTDPYEVHSFNLSDAIESLLYVNAVGGESTPLSEHKGDFIDVSYYYAKPISFVAGPNDSRYAPGELIKGVRLVLVTPEGEQLHTTSPTAIKTVGALHRTPIGKKKFNPPIRLKLGKVKTRGNFNAQTLTVVPREVAKPQA